MTDTHAGGFLYSEAELALTKDLPISKPQVYRAHSAVTDAFSWMIHFTMKETGERKSVEFSIGTAEYDHLCATHPDFEGYVNELARKQIRLELGLDG